MWSGEFPNKKESFEGSTCMHCIDHGENYMYSYLPLSLCGRSENRKQLHNCDGRQCPMRPHKHTCNYRNNGVPCDKELVPVVDCTGYTRYTCPDLRSHGSAMQTRAVLCYEGTCSECHSIFNDVFPPEEDILVKSAARV